jgi:hypothetical protein
MAGARSVVCKRCARGRLAATSLTPPLRMRGGGRARRPPPQPRSLSWSGSWALCTGPSQRPKSSLLASTDSISSALMMRTARVANSARSRVTRTVRFVLPKDSANRPSQLRSERMALLLVATFQLLLATASLAARLAEQDRAVRTSGSAELDPLVQDAAVGWREPAKESPPVACWAR